MLEVLRLGGWLRLRLRFYACGWRRSSGPRRGRRMRTSAAGRRDNLLGGRKGHDLLLNSRLIACGNVVEAFHVASFVRRVDAALNAARERFDAILQRRTQQRIGRKLNVLIRLSGEHEEIADRFLDVIQRE